jgi:hypothetical protein
MWILQGFYPGGVGADETGQAYAVGITALVVWVLVFMALNVPGGIRFGALAGFMGFSMAFLNPQTKLDTYSHGFQINLKTAEFNAIGNALLGSVLALICACLPVPMSALAKAKEMVRRASKSLRDVNKELLKYYAGSSANDSVHRIKAHLDWVDTELNKADGFIGAAWWECWEVGKRGQSLRWLAKATGTLRGMSDRLRGMLTVAINEDFDGSHTAFMTEGLVEKFNAMVEAQANLLEHFLNACEDGHIDAHEMEESTDLTAKLKRTQTKLSKEFDTLRRGFGSKLEEMTAKLADGAGTGGFFGCSDSQRVASKSDKPKIAKRAPASADVGSVNSTVLGEHYFVILACTTTRDLVEYSDWMQTATGSPAGAMGTCVGSVTACFKGVADADNLTWTARNAVTLFIAYFLGHAGHGTIIAPNNTAMAGMVCAFLAKGSRPSLQAGVEKIAFIVLSTVLVNLAQAELGQCSWFLQTANGFVMFGLVYFMMHLCFQSSVYGGLGRGLAATIATTLMSPCSDKDFDDGAYAGNYKGIVYTVIGIGIMFTLDMALSSKAASLGARESVLDCVEHTRKAFNIATGSGDLAAARAEFSAATGLLGKAKSFVACAQGEPRIYKAPWRAGLWDRLLFELGRVHQKMDSMLVVMEGDTKTHTDNLITILRDLPAFPAVRDKLEATITTTVGLTNEVLPWENDHLCTIKTIRPGKTIQDVGFEALIQQAAKKTPLPSTPPDSVEFDLVARLCVFMLMFQLLDLHLINLNSEIIQHADAPAE